MDMPGQIPWQEVLIFLGAFIIWYAGVSVIWIATGRGSDFGGRLIYGWTLAWWAVCVAAYFYVITRGGLTTLLGS